MLNTVRLLLIFWSIWYTGIVTTNLADLFADVFQWEKWRRFKSGNLAEVRKASTVLTQSSLLPLVLFLGVIVIQSVASVLFWQALTVSWWSSGPSSHAIGDALDWGIGVWACFLVADSVFRTFQFTPVHFIILCAHILTVLCVFGLR